MTEPTKTALIRALRVAKAVGAAGAPAEILDQALDSVIELTHAERGFVVIPTASGKFEITAARNYLKSTIGAQEQKFSRTLVKLAVTENTAILIPLPMDPRLAGNKSVSDIGFRSALAAPLVAHGETQGAIVLDERTRATRFEKEDKDLLELVAGQAALALERYLLERKNAQLEAELAAERSARFDPGATGIVGNSRAIRQLLAKIERFASSRSAALITGETGTGKELVARALHNLGNRKDKPFVACNVNDLSETVLEAELFGHAKGGFTGADKARLGLFRAAEGGTLFLDEIGDFPKRFQVKLLRALQEGVVKPVGDDKMMKVDVRIVAATNGDLEALVEAGEFRADLLFRLNVLRLETPPLRDRIEDIPQLANHFVRTLSLAQGVTPAPRLGAKALSALEKHDWPGNVRELENAIQRAVVIGNAEIAVADLGLTSKKHAAADLGARAKGIDRAAAKAALAAANGNVSRAVKLLGISRAQFYRKNQGWRLV